MISSGGGSVENQDVVGRVASPNRLSSDDGAPSGLHPAGFDPARSFVTTAPMALFKQPEQLCVISATGEVSWADAACPEKIMQYPLLSERIAVLALWHATHRDSDRSGEASETRRGSTEGESAGGEAASPKRSSP